MRAITVRDLHTARSESIRVMLFNVGQGDHILLRFPDGEYGIIDFHYAVKLKTVEPPALSYFKELKRVLSAAEFEQVTLSFVCISHTDADHVKGLAESVKWFFDHGLFVRDFWLGASLDKAQLVELLRDKVRSIVKEFDVGARVRHNGEILSFEMNVATFFQYFDKWERKKFPRSVDAGDGEYLVEIRELPRPCSLSTIHAMNLGPLTRHIKQYLADLNLETIKDILGIGDSSSADKNLLSHILRIRYGKRNLIFGGDTHKEIWETCLAKYVGSRSGFVDQHGPVASHFIKVSHHGSKNSSSPEIWKALIPEQETAVLCISAGRHNGYKHPHSETLEHIRQHPREAQVVSTNICTACLAAYGSEHHIWYEQYLDRNVNYGKSSANSYDTVIDGVIRRITIPKGSRQSELGLFAFIFEIPAELDAAIEVSVALTNVSPVEDCFFLEHEHKLFEACNNAKKWS